MFIISTLKTHLTIVAVILISISSFADEISIIDIKRNIPLSDEAPIYKDFYLDAGSDFGLKKNQIVTVYRRMLVKDSTGLKTFGEFETPVGQLKIIALNNRVSIAREVKLISREEEAMLEQIGIMTGDRIALED